MTFKTSRRVCRLSAKILALLMVFGPLCGAAWSQKTTPQKSSQQSIQALQAPVQQGIQLSWYIAAGYSIFGPAGLSSVNSQSLGFPRGYGLPDLTFSLAKKAVTVMNQAGFSVPFSSLAPGAKVIVCDRSDSVVIITVSDAEASNAKR